MSLTAHAAEGLDRAADDFFAQIKRLLAEAGHLPAEEPHRIVIGTAVQATVAAALLAEPITGDPTGWMEGAALALAGILVQQPDPRGVLLLFNEVVMKTAGAMMDKPAGTQAS